MALTTQDEDPNISVEGTLRDSKGKGGLPCGARYCHCCHEECGVIVNAYILQDIAFETDESSD